MIKRELTVADIFTYMGMDSKQLYDIVNNHYKDKPDDYKVRIADYKNDTSKFFTVLELKLAASDLVDRESSPKIVDEETFNVFIDNVIKQHEKIKLPTFDLFKDNEICLQLTPNHKFHDPKDNTLTPTLSLTKKYNEFESIDWSKYKIIHEYSRNFDGMYCVRGVTKENLEKSKTNYYGLSRVL